MTWFLSSPKSLVEPPYQRPHCPIYQLVLEIMLHFVTTKGTKTANVRHSMLAIAKWGEMLWLQAWLCADTLPLQRQADNCL